LNEVLPPLVKRTSAAAFARFKRQVIAEMARMTATLHTARVFHKDLYLCHFFLDPEEALRGDTRAALALIDLHRLHEHRLLAVWWRSKDLGQLLFSTYGVEGITERDRLRFWKHYRRLTRMRLPHWQGQMIRLRAARYLRHNRTPR
jgi:Lipopolysaccharide kinase (Kdo/WaaP) family